MSKDTSTSDKRAGNDRRQADNPPYDGPERRAAERRKDTPAPK